MLKQIYYDIKRVSNRAKERRNLQRRGVVGGLKGEVGGWLKFTKTAHSLGEFLSFFSDGGGDGNEGQSKAENAKKVARKMFTQWRE